MRHIFQIVAASLFSLEHNLETTRERERERDTRVQQKDEQMKGFGIYTAQQ